MDSDYSKREIDAQHKEILHRFDDITSKLSHLSDKVTIQNGRVSKIEIKSSWMAGVGIAGTVLIGIIMSLIVYSFQLSQDNLKNVILLEIKGSGEIRTIEDAQNRAIELKAEADKLQNKVDEIK